MVRNDDKKRLVKNARPGFLIRKPDGKYFIALSIYTTDRKEDFITIKDFQAKYGKVKFRNSRIHWDGKIAYIVTGNQWAKKPDKLLDATEYKQFKEYLKALREEKDAGKISESYYAAEARKHGKQIIRFTSLDYIEPNRDKWLEVPDEVQSSYRHDRNRGAVVDFISSVKNSSPVKEIRFDFVSPVSFRIDDFDVPYPRAELIFASLADKWTQAAMPAAADKKIIRELAAQIRLTQWRGQSKIFYFAHDRGIPAFWGEFFYNVAALSKDVRKVFVLLAKFAEFAGVGRLTGQGFGQMRIAFST